MTDYLDSLKNVWKEAQNSQKIGTVDIAGLIARAQAKKRNTLKMHVFNILILTATLIGLVAFFTLVAQFQQTLSHIGIILMLAGLTIRILIEVYSIYLSNWIDLSETALKTNVAWLKFYQFRQKVHGPVTLTIIGFYTVGFYMLTPEFTMYFTLLQVVLIDLSYVIAALIFTLSIRRAIKKENGYLNDILKVQKDLISNEKEN